MYTSNDTRKRVNFVTAYPPRIASLVISFTTVFSDFASARPPRIASKRPPQSFMYVNLCLSTSPKDCIIRADNNTVTVAGLCLSTSPKDCIVPSSIPTNRRCTLPQHVPQGLHRQKCSKRNAIIEQYGCEQVDSFSD